ncbi:Chaperone protein DnaK [Corynebacterium glaucum]|uniref:Chaperone protein DnaK n=1 Tax=Corynebacterium glaucum TaxID=187491 RepID=A0A1Q2HU93_9CORY|nr:Hsp70 family protein [Corynebacterium glaucum]AQQ14418.1 Chaperone protein DnaK [Corynebacterium glaucum]
MANEWTLSIDLGTATTTAAHAYAGRGGAETLWLSNDGPGMPSSVFWDYPGRFLAGHEAVARQVAHPVGFIPSAKEMLSAKSHYVLGQALPPHWPAAIVMQSVVQRAIAVHNDTPPSGVVITHPYEWDEDSDPMQQITHAAATLGLPHAAVRFMPEPIAAARHFASHHRARPGERIIVCDCGAGNTRAAVLEAQPGGEFAVVLADSARYDNGKATDKAVLSTARTHLEERYPHLSNALDNTRNMEERYEFFRQMKRAMHALSHSPVVTVPVRVGGHTVELGILRSEVEPQLRYVTDDLRRLLERVHKKANLQNLNNAATIYPVGGVSQIPQLVNVLREFGNVAPLDYPETAVARGALSEPAAPGLFDFLWTRKR